MRAELVSTVASAAAMTTMLSEIPAGFRKMLSSFASPVSSVMPSDALTVNPDALALTVYTDGARPGTTKRPCSLATVIRAAPVRSFTTTYVSPRHGASAGILNRTGELCLSGLSTRPKLEAPRSTGLPACTLTM